MTLSAIGEAETPAGGSVCMRYIMTMSVSPLRAEEDGGGGDCTLKSRMSRRRAEVDMVTF